MRPSKEMETTSEITHPRSHRSNEQSIDAIAIAVAVGRNLAFPVTDDKGNQLYTKEGKPAVENRTGIEKWTSHLHQTIPADLP